MPRPVQAGDKLTISTKKSDVLALAWLNSQPNRSEAVMGLLREAARRQFILQASTAPQDAKPLVTAAPPVTVVVDPDKVEGFDGMGDFLSGMAAMEKRQV